MSDELFTVEDLAALPAAAVGVGSILTVSKGHLGRVVALEDHLGLFWVVKVHVSGGQYEFIRVPCFWRW